MQDLIARLRGRLQHGLAVQETLDRLARHGLALYPYLVYCESTDPPAAHREGPESLHARLLTERDVPQLVAMRQRPDWEATIHRRLARGDVGIGAFADDSIVAYTWCEIAHLRGFGRDCILRALADDEATLADSYTVPAWRGRGVLLVMRGEVYGTMRAMGKTRLYSVCMYFNRSIRRLKAKVGAHAVELRLSINLYERFKRDVLLKRYTDDA
ncbi:hypothetical protein BH24PSE2_BH24PSE2_11610 [soil metagenome]